MDAEAPYQPIEPTRGAFLVASPRMLDPNFMHSVVLLCDHGEAGSYGVAINRPGTLTVSDLDSDVDLLEGRSDGLWMGGPVAVETLQVLHRIGVSIPGSLHVVGDVHLGGDPAVLHAGLSSDGVATDDVRFVLGYSGWGAGQLQLELAEGAWVVCPADESLVFDPEPETLWRRVLRSLGGSWAALADVPPDPNWN